MAQESETFIPNPRFRLKRIWSLITPLMSKTALLFAGQGAQVVGMGRDLAEKFPSAKTWFDRANVALGYDLAAVCFTGPEPELTKTENAQPGIFLVSWVAYQLLRVHRAGAGTDQNGKRMEPGIFLVSWVAYQLLRERVPGLGFEATAGLSLRRIHRVDGGAGDEF